MKIGIISGAGAYTGALFYKDLIEQFAQIATTDAEFPYIKLINYPFMSLNINGVVNEVVATNELNNCFEQLIDCDKIIVFCFSLHKYIKDKNILEKIISLPDIINKNQTNKKSLLLCSNSSKQDNIFNSECAYLPDNLYFYLDQIIECVIKGTLIDEKANSAIKQYAKDNNIDIIILGCTELFYYNFQIDNSLIVNPKNKLIETIINLTLKGTARAALPNK